MSRTIQISGASVALSLTGFASNVTGATWALSATDSGDSLAHKVTIRNDSATDHSLKTALLTGTDANGNVQTETLALPNNAATTTSTKFFKTLTSIVPSASIGADTMDIGWAAASVTAWTFVDAWTETFNLGFGCSVDAGSPTYSVQHSYDGGNANPFTHSVVSAKTQAAEGSYTSPIRALRLAWTAAGTVSMSAIQAGV